MNIDELRQEIERDEGRVNAVYLDHLSLPTIGIGHLVVESDPEYGLPVGTRIDDERVNELFEQDIQVTISECEKLFSNFNDLPDEVQKICANMMFNLGRPRFSKFKKFQVISIISSLSPDLHCVSGANLSTPHRKMNDIIYPINSGPSIVCQIPGGA